MKHLNHIPVSKAKYLDRVGNINSDKEAVVVRDILNVLGQHKLNVAFGLKILDNAKDSLIYCTRIESEYVLENDNPNPNLDSPIPSGQSFVV